MATPILLIEDDAHTANLLARTLQETGTFEVTSVRSAVTTAAAPDFDPVTE